MTRLAMAVLWTLTTAGKANAVQVGEPAPAFGSNVRWIKGDPVPELRKGRRPLADVVSAVPRGHPPHEERRRPLVTFLFWIDVPMAGIVGAAIWELHALARPPLMAALSSPSSASSLPGLCSGNDRRARPGHAELRFEEEPPDRVLTLDLSWDQPKP